MVVTTAGTDDNVIGVVGAERALRALRCWHSLMASTGLIMAIPLKRSIGTTLWSSQTEPSGWAVTSYSGWRARQGWRTLSLRPTVR